MPQANQEAFDAFRALLQGKLKDAGVYEPQQVQGPPAPVDRSYRGPYTPHTTAALTPSPQVGDINQIDTVTQPTGIEPASLQPPAIPPITSPSPQMAGVEEVKYDPKQKSYFEHYYDNTNEKSGGVYLYSVGRKKRTVGEFDKAMEKYSDTGIVPKGYKLIHSGTFVDTLHQVAGSVQRSADALADVSFSQTRGVGGSSAEPGLPLPLAGIKYLMQQAAPHAAEQVTEPGNLGRNAGLIATALATKKINYTPAVRAAVDALGGTLGYTAGRSVAGEAPSAGDIGVEGATNLAGAYAADKLADIAGFGLGKLAQSKVYNDVVKYIKDKYGPIAANPDALTAILSTEKGYREVVDKGIQSIVGTADDAAKGMLTTIQQQMPRTMSKTGASEVERNLKGISDFMLSIIHKGPNVPDKNLIDKDVGQRLGRYLANIQQVFDKEFTTQSPQVRQLITSKLEKVVVDYITETNKYVGAAQAMQLLQKAGGNPVNVQRLQALLQQAGRGSGPTFADITEIAGRGSFGVDKGVYPSDALKKVGSFLPLVNILSRIIPDKAVRVGTRYTGSIPGSTSLAVGRSAATAATAGGINRFLEEE